MKYMILLPVLALAACAGLSGKEYSIAAYDSNGRLLSKRVELDSNEAGISIARDTLCRVHPGATVRVHNNFTRMEVKKYSPYSCRRHAVKSKR